jgi:hypothetical protein
MRSHQRWDHLSSVVRLGLIRSNEQSDEINIYSSPVPAFHLGDILPLFLGVSPEDVVHRFIDAIKYELGDPLPLMLLQRAHCRGMLSCSFWLCLLLELRAKRALQKYDSSDSVGVDELYCDHLMLNLAYHYAIFSAECEKELTGTVDDGTIRFGFFEKFAQLVLFALSQLCRVNVSDIEEASRRIQSTILFWTLGIDVTKDSASTSVASIVVTGAAAPGGDGAEASPGSRTLTTREIKMRRYKDFCDEGKMPKKAASAPMVAVVMGEAPTRMPLYARTTATKKGVGTESGELTRPETILKDVQLENMVRSLEDELAEARRREQEENRRLMEEAQKEQSAATSAMPQRGWQTSPFAFVSELDASSVTPLMKIFLETCTIHSQESLLESTADVSALQRSGALPVSLMTSKVERTQGRRRLPLCSKRHEMSVASGQASCDKCGKEAAVAGRFLTCDTCLEVLCRVCTAGASSLSDRRRLPSPADVFGKDAVAVEWIHNAPDTKQCESLVRKIVADRCSSGLTRLIKTVNYQRKLPTNLFDMKIQHATWVGEKDDSAVDAAIVHAADTALKGVHVEAESAVSDQNCTSSIAPAHRWRPPSPAPSAKQCASRPSTPIRRPSSAMMLGAFLVGDTLGQTVRMNETLTSPQGARPSSAARLQASATDNPARPRSVSTSAVLRPQSAVSVASSSSRIHSALHFGCRPQQSRVPWSKPQATDATVLDDRRAIFQAQKQHVLQRVKMINKQSVASEEARREFTRHVIRQEARNSLESFQESKGALRRLHAARRTAIFTAADEVVEAMEATTQNLHGLDEIDCIKTALITINKHFEALPETVRKHAIAFSGRFKPKLLYLIREYKMQYRDRNLWPSSLDDLNMTRAMEATRSEPSVIPSSSVSKVVTSTLPSDSIEDEAEDADQEPPHADPKAEVEKLLAEQKYDVATEKRLLAEQNRRQAVLLHERHIQQLAGIEVRPIGKGLVVAGGQIIWADTNRSVGSEATEVRNKYIAGKLYR